MGFRSLFRLYWVRVPEGRYNDCPDCDGFGLVQVFNHTTLQPYLGPVTPGRRRRLQLENTPEDPAGTWVYDSDIRICEICQGQGGWWE